MERIEIFNIENREFVNKFYFDVKEYVTFTFDEISNAISKDNNNFFKHSFLSEEIATIIVLNKAIFQNILGFFELCEKRLPFPAFNSLRSAIEGIRLFRAFFLDKNFRNDYISNQNTDFRNTRDYDFMQSKVNSKLESLEKNLRAQEKIPLSIKLDNHSLTKGSAMAELHSELSKWSHLLNINLLLPTQINEGRINLGIYDEYGIKMQLFIKKYLEGAYLITCHHEDLFLNASFSKEYRDYSISMVENYTEYIKIYYK